LLKILLQATAKSLRQNGIGWRLLQIRCRISKPPAKTGKNRPVRAAAHEPKQRPPLSRGGFLLG